MLESPSAMEGPNTAVGIPTSRRDTKKGLNFSPWKFTKQTNQADLLVYLPPVNEKALFINNLRTVTLLLSNSH